MSKQQTEQSDSQNYLFIYFKWKINCIILTLQIIIPDTRLLKSTSIWLMNLYGVVNNPE